MENLARPIGETQLAMPKQLPSSASNYQGQKHEYASMTGPEQNRLEVA